MIAQIRSWFTAGILAVGALASTATHAQSVVAIGTGTAAGAANVLLSTTTTTNKYSRTITIYTAAELRAAGARAGNITKIGWYKGGTGEYTTNDAQMTIYVKRVTAGALPGDPVTWATEVTGATPVYTNSTLSLPTGTGWKDFTLSAPFAWNGTDNLEVFVDWFRNSAPTADITWQYTAGTASSGLHATQVNSAISGLTTVRYAANRPNIQFTFSTPAAVRGAQTLALASVAPNPFDDHLILRFAAPRPGQAVEAVLTDALGRVRYRRTFVATAEHSLSLPASLAAGVYLLSLTSGNQAQVLRVMHN
ncbi:T9SS type A sorting domain-containing protein [Hymenobacter busanensis]|uniref:T9SS type A sorting domain-containing protein n=1 Tax=Hymenobacter busanensis TaxID=2607656 RepID=A0A7L5A3N0_9BACT|nr:T9SS type A sorting domain-containing protein [Hymenobacter busanensis]KAA9331367.1 T9SS type A sorting domain-containing protein [Hymenobacter busanensis]QHJ08520.1 T9SS type A sorting domain-containing protein [Hymenobacter busanensis]